MRKPSRLLASPVVVLLIGGLIIWADQLSKMWIRANVPPWQSLVDFGIFQIAHVRNTGAAFGLFQGQSFLLTIFSILGVAALLVYLFAFQRRLPLLEGILGRLALGLVLGGAAGNLIDRLRLGYVTDFIDFKIWPAFNVADSAITVGMLLLVYCLLRMAGSGEHGSG